MTRVRITAFLAGLLVLSAANAIKAQDSTSQLTPATTQTEEERLKQQEALEKQATVLLEQVVGEAQLLKLPENRIRLQAAAGALLWKRNPERARSMFSLAAEGVAEMVRSTDDNLQRLALPLRQEVVLSAAQHDATLAYQLLAITRSLTPAPSTAGAGDWNRRFRGQYSDANLEEQLLAQVSALDPKLAAQKLEESLAKGQYPNTLTQVLAGLESQDKEAAAKLTAKVVSKLHSENMLANPQAQMLALNLLRAGPRQARTATGGTPAIVTQATVNPAGVPVLAESSFQALLNSIVDAALRAAPQTGSNQRGGNRGRGNFGGPQVTGQSQLTDGQLEQQNARRLLSALQRLLPQIDQYLPSRATAVRNKMTELGMGSNQAADFNQLNSLIRQGTSESLVAAAPSAPPRLQSQLYQQAAQKALDEGDVERARQIANDHLDATTRDRVQQRLEVLVLAKKVDAGNMDELRNSLGNLRSDDERIDLLLQLAAQAQWAVGEQKPELAAAGDPKLALTFLGEAQRLTNRRATNYRQFDQQLRVADAFASLDPARSFEVLDPGISQLNELLSAAALLSGFEVNVFKEGELVLGGGSGLGEMVSRYGQQLATLAKTDFSRAESSANRFQLVEPRLFSHLAIVRSVLGVPQVAPIGNGFGGGRGFGRRAR